MANYKQLTNSPLGLIPRDIISPYGSTASGNSADEYQTQFSGQNKYYRYQKTGKNNNVFASKGSKLHTDEIYDTSTQNIINQFQAIDHLSLKYADFAYLKDYGVYPNNRLIVLRRFANPVSDDIYSLGNDEGPGTPISTIVGYVDNDTDFLNFDFGEEWTAAEASFEKILNSIGSDFSIGGASLNLGTYAKKGANLMPSPPASVLFQRQVLAKLGLINEDDVSAVPLGDPNLIKEARVRRTLGSEEPGSGLTGKIKVTFTVRYEQKFIQGVDPTLVYMDILGTLLSMGTSKSSFYLGTNSKIEKFIRDMIKDPMKTLKNFILATVQVLTPIIEKVTAVLISDKIKESGTDEQKAAGDKQSLTEKAKNTYKYLTNFATSDLNELAQTAIQGVKDAIRYVSDYINKRFRVQAFGIMAALTGAPSTPWHVTIGNPLRPILCSGDMECEDINVKLGPQLSFNDLPTYIEATIKLTSARNHGLQELFSKLNSGGLRTVNKAKSSIIEPGITFWTNKLEPLLTDEEINTAVSENISQDIKDRENKVNQAIQEEQEYKTKVAAADRSIDIIKEENSLLGYGVAAAEFIADNIGGEETLAKIVVTGGETIEVIEEKIDEAYEAVEEKIDEVYEAYDKGSWGGLYDKSVELGGRLVNWIRRSDIRLKNIIKKVGVEKGINIYHFTFNSDPDTIYQGVIAQELIGTQFEDCLTIDENGLYLVDYGKLGIEFKKGSK